jgi:uncharacterized protein with PIN domain/sulfur carrier protein ThiS
MAYAEFRFLGELNDFLSLDRRHTRFRRRVEEHSTIKDTIESLGVPHTEIGLVLVNGQPVGLESRIRDGDVVEANPGGYLPGPPRFVLDTHLGRLARYLRMLGLDTLYRNDYRDDELARLSRGDDRILLTRDIGLLKRSIVRRGYWVRADGSEAQLAEIVRRFDLVGSISPFGRCLRCNGLLEPIAREVIEDRLPLRTRHEQVDFRRCPTCGGIYWKGSHYDRMRRLIERIQRTTGDLTS